MNALVSTCNLLSSNVIATQFGTNESQLMVLTRAAQLILSIVTVAVGGLLATYFWRKITRPDLDILSNPVTTVPLGPDSDIWLYRISIKNNGRRAAKNCKAKLRYSVETEKETYHILSTAQWAESSKPTRIDINADEEAQFNILKYNKKDNTVSFPSSTGGNPESPIYVLNGDKEDSYQTSQPNIAINPGELTSGEIKKNDIKITSENAAPAEARMEIKIESEGLVTVVVE